jgi:predicted RNase H-like HicB family nuclease
MSIKSNIELQGNLPIQIISEEGGYSVVCPILDIASQGETVEIAMKMFSECLEMFFEDLIENDNLEKVLLECGWKIEIKHKNSPIKIIIPPQILNTTISLNNIFNA